MKAVIKLGVPLAVVIPRRAQPGGGWARKKDLRFPPYPDHGGALLKLRPILTTQSGPRSISPKKTH